VYSYLKVERDTFDVYLGKGQNQIECFLSFISSHFLWLYAMKNLSFDEMKTYDFITSSMTVESVEH
jgi:hypothetical protein